MNYNFKSTELPEETQPENVGHKTQVGARKPYYRID